MPSFIREYDEVKLENNLYTVKVEGEYWVSSFERQQGDYESSCLGEVDIEVEGQIVEIIDLNDEERKIEGQEFLSLTEKLKHLIDIEDDQINWEKLEG